MTAETKVKRIMHKNLYLSKLLSSTEAKNEHIQALVRAQLPVPDIRMKLTISGQQFFKQKQDEYSKDMSNKCQDKEKQQQSPQPCLCPSQGLVEVDPGLIHMGEGQGAQGQQAYGLKHHQDLDWGPLFSQK
jgi:hypothetical protein